MSYRKYRNDPRWLYAKFASQCAGCKEPVNKGDEVFYYPSAKSVYGAKCGCGQDRCGEFEAAAFDEDNNLCM